MEAGAKLSVMNTSNLVDETVCEQLVGSLIYLTTTSHDLSFLVGLGSGFMDKPSKSWWKAAKRILQYARVTLNYGLQFESCRFQAPRLVISGLGRLY